MDLKSQKAQKIHLLCQLRNKLPSEVFNEPEAYIDWALCMEAKYPPGSLTFNVAEDKLEKITPIISIEEKLMGKSKDRFLSKFIPKYKKRIK